MPTPLRNSSRQTAKYLEESLKEREDSSNGDDDDDDHFIDKGFALDVNTIRCVDEQQERVSSLDDTVAAINRARFTNDLFVTINTNTFVGIARFSSLESSRLISICNDLVICVLFCIQLPAQARCPVLCYGSTVIYQPSGREEFQTNV